jgi:hypothetical protein
MGWRFPAGQQHLERRSPGLQATLMCQWLQVVALFCW